MFIYVDNKKIKLPRCEYAHGSEGVVYKIGDKIYKLYYLKSMDEGYGSKEKEHKYLMGLNTKNINLPTNSIYDEHGRYIGYVTDFVTGGKKCRNGFTLMKSEKVIENLKALEEDFKYLSDNYVLTEDVAIQNCILDLENEKVNIIDPGRYRNHVFLRPSDYIEANKKRLDYFVELLLYMDFVKYKPVGPKRMEQLLKQYIKEEKEKMNIENYSEYFKEKLDGYENIDEYVKTLQKSIR